MTLESTEDVIPFDGEEIDLTELIRDTLIINEPSQVLCQDDCKVVRSLRSKFKCFTLFL